MSNMPIHVNATFNPLGKIRPDFIWVEDEEEMMHLYKIKDIEYNREEKLAGVPAILFVCHIQVGDHLQQIKIRYHVNTHQWILMQ